MTLISIVIPTYRRPAMLQRAIRSCRSQQGVEAPFEIVVVDNDAAGSARDTVAAIAAQSAVPLRYVAEPRPGISQARNAGVANASGRYLAFLDDDEEAVPTWLASFHKALVAADADAVVGPVRPRFPAGAAVDTYRHKVYTRDAAVATGTRLRRWSGIGNTLLDKERCFGTAAEPFDPRLGLTGGEDSLFFRQLLRRGGKLVWCAEAVAWESVEADKLMPRYLLRRAFRGAQTTTYVCTAVRPPEVGRAAYFMMAGAVQVLLYAPAALALRALPGERWLPFAGKAWGALGKVLWHPKLQPRLYR